MSQLVSARGMRDFLPNETLLREKLRHGIIAGYLRAGYSLIETPAVETLQLLDRATSSENSKLMFKISKRGTKLSNALQNKSELCDLGLRYDLTMPLVRYYINHQSQLPTCGGTFKSLQLGSVWRAERPQLGRYRQFMQCDIDIIAGSSPLAEYELLIEGVKRLQEIITSPLVVQLNDRRILALLASELGLPPADTYLLYGLLDKIDKLGKEEVIKLVAAQYGKEITGQLFKRLAALENDSSLEQNQALTGYLQQTNLLVAALRSYGFAKCQFVFNPYLARGIEYYSGTIFEVKTAGEQQTIAAGGSYDNLIKSVGGPAVKACGFSLGFERIFALYQQENSAKDLLVQEAKHWAVLVPRGVTLLALLQLLKKATDQRDFAFYTLKSHSLAKQLTALAEQGFTHCLSYNADADKLTNHCLR